MLVVFGVRLFLLLSMLDLPHIADVTFLTDKTMHRKEKKCIALACFQVSLVSALVSESSLVSESLFLVAESRFLAAESLLVAESRFLVAESPGFGCRIILGYRITFFGFGIFPQPLSMVDSSHGFSTHPVAWLSPEKVVIKMGVYPISRQTEIVVVSYI